MTATPGSHLRSPRAANAALPVASAAQSAIALSVTTVETLARIPPEIATARAAGAQIPPGKYRNACVLHHMLMSCQLDRPDRRIAQLRAPSSHQAADPTNANGNGHQVIAPKSRFRVARIAMKARIPIAPTEATRRRTVNRLMGVSKIPLRRSLT
jgi:hypothetical protein